MLLVFTAYWLANMWQLVQKILSVLPHPRVIPWFIYPQFCTVLGIVFFFSAPDAKLYILPSLWIAVHGTMITLFCKTFSFTIVQTNTLLSTIAIWIFSIYHMLWFIVGMLLWLVVIPAFLWTLFSTLDCWDHGRIVYLFIGPFSIWIQGLLALCSLCYFDPDV